MIIKFTVGNFLSFNKKRTLSFIARRGVSELKDNFFLLDNQSILRSIVLYGANSSGKSNLIKALFVMQDVVLNSVKLNETDELNYNPFLLSGAEDEPSFFEIVFNYNALSYRYGFEYKLNSITKEWLFEIKKSGKEDVLFVREDDQIAVSDKYEEGKGKEESTNRNRLFLSLVAQLGGKKTNQILQFFTSFNIISGITHDLYRNFSMKMFHEKKDGHKESLVLFQKLNLGFQNIQIIESEDQPSKPDISDRSTLRRILSATSKKVSLNTIHNKYNDNGKIIDNISWSKDKYESDGTKKLIDLSGPIFDTLLKGKTLVIDELDSKLHPLITIEIIKLFNSPETNPNNAQLLFTTHDTNLLSNNIFRRDQVWFTEKDQVEQSDLYSLDDFIFPDGTKVRKDANLEKNYIAGRYGAIPYITNL